MDQNPGLFTHTWHHRPFWSWCLNAAVETETDLLSDCSKSPGVCLSVTLQDADQSSASGTFRTGGATVVTSGRDVSARAQCVSADGRYFSFSVLLIEVLICRSSIIGSDISLELFNTKQTWIYNLLRHHKGGKSFYALSAFHNCRKWKGRLWLSSCDLCSLSHVAFGCVWIKVRHKTRLN